MMKDRSTWYLILAIAIGLLVGKLIKKMTIGLILVVLIGFIVVLAKSKKK
jgi:F0F1-type ATP synthase assembly protein I